MKKFLFLILLLVLTNAFALSSCGGDDDPIDTDGDTDTDGDLAGDEDAPDGDTPDGDTPDGDLETDGDTDGEVQCKPANTDYADANDFPPAEEWWDRACGVCVLPQCHTDTTPSVTFTGRYQRTVETTATDCSDIIAQVNELANVGHIHKYPPAEMEFQGECLVEDGEVIGILLGNDEITCQTNLQDMDVTSLETAQFTWNGDRAEGTAKVFLVNVPEVGGQDCYIDFDIVIEPYTGPDGDLDEEGEGTDGDVPDGDIPDGDAPDGDQDGDVTDGDGDEWPPSSPWWGDGECFLPACDNSAAVSFDTSGQWKRTLTTTATTCDPIIGNFDPRAIIDNVEITGPEPLYIQGECDLNADDSLFGVFRGNTEITCETNIQTMDVVSTETAIVTFSGDQGVGEAHVYLTNVQDIAGGDCQIDFDVLFERQ